MHLIVVKLNSENYILNCYQRAYSQMVWHGKNFNFKFHA